MRCIVKMDVLEEKSKELREYTDYDIKSKIDELSKIFDNIKWHGKAKKTFIDNYKEKINELSKVLLMLDFYSVFMEKASKNYTNATQEVEAEWQKLLNNIVSEQVINDG